MAMLGLPFIGKVVRPLLSAVYNSYNDCVWLPWIIWFQI
jgi:hypothetical protein